MAANEPSEDGGASSPTAHWQGHGHKTFCVDIFRVNLYVFAFLGQVAKYRRRPPTSTATPSVRWQAMARRTIERRHTTRALHSASVLASLSHIVAEPCGKHRFLSTVCFENTQPLGPPNEGIFSQKKKKNITFQRISVVLDVAGSPLKVVIIIKAYPHSLRTVLGSHPLNKFLLSCGLHSARAACVKARVSIAVRGASHFGELPKKPPCP
ncbi:hypothetical protein TRVL_02432 [Trypanosoma vivax]|nr:hypothetical protein TRVL_02432 [Trypanosoma vivax]